MKRMSTLTSERRNDLHLTSTGVALARRQSAPLDHLPPLTKSLHSSLPLPPLLSLSAPTTNDIYTTTTKSAHDDKDLTLSPLHKKAPGHWKVNYTLEAINKMSSKPWRRPLTMSNQMSEMRAQFSGQPEIISRVLPTNDPQPPTLSDHFTNGVTKELVPSTTVRRREGREKEVTADGVLSKTEPYLTTNNRFHRRFSAPEQLGYAQKDAATYWLCEDYPKAWGHGTKVNPLTTPTWRSERGPMRDRTVFRTGTSVRELSSSVKPLSQTVYNDTYSGFEKEERESLFHCPVHPSEAHTQGWTGQWNSLSLSSFSKPLTNRTVYNDTYSGFEKEERERLFHCPVHPSEAHTQEGYDSSLLQLVPQMYTTGNMTYGQPRQQLPLQEDLH